MASVFTLIMEGKIPGHFVWQDDIAIAILTIQPIREGHVLVIPRLEVDQWTDLPAEVMAHLVEVSHKISQVLKQAFPCKRVGLMIAGLEVPHTHIHLVPMDTMEDLSFAKAKSAEADALKNIAAKIRDLLQ
ncbi:MAG TPA: HIT family protein [Cellvibrio sp.]|nr:HIT family protein [Cellvibrio sp.]